MSEDSDRSQKTEEATPRRLLEAREKGQVMTSQEVSHLAVMIGGALIAGFKQSAFMAMTSTFVQEVVSDEFRGRVLSLYIMLAGGTMAFLNLGFGRVTDLFDVRAVFILPAVLWLIIIAVAVFKSSEFKSLIRHGRFVSNDEKVLI